jgi:hypothetical protein
MRASCGKSIAGRPLAFSSPYGPPVAAIRSDGRFDGRRRGTLERGFGAGENPVAVQAADSTQGGVRRPAGGPVRRFVVDHLGSRRVSRVIYGAIIGLALVVALEAHPPAPGVVIATLLGTAVAVALAELYSEVVGFETGERRKASLSELRHVGADIAAVAFGVAFLAVFFVLAATSLLENEAAFTAAKWTGLGLIGVYGSQVRAYPAPVCPSRSCRRSGWR